jgi:hypothetical protein
MFKRLGFCHATSFRVCLHTRNVIFVASHDKKIMFRVNQRNFHWCKPALIGVSELEECFPLKEIFTRAHVGTFVERLENLVALVTLVFAKNLSSFFRQRTRTPE